MKHSQQSEHALQVAIAEYLGWVIKPPVGSGTTGMACMAEGFDCILCEREAEYVKDIRARIAHVHGDDLPLFSGGVHET